MIEEKYVVNQLSIGTILSWVENKEIAIPEIQRPFVWSSTQVRNLMDSLYQGYPVGYIITWQNPKVKLKDGRDAQGKKILIDGQQRVMALRAAVSGLQIIDKRYKESRIIISFNPLTEEFATKTPALEKNSLWISDISEVMTTGYDILDLVDSYSEKNHEIERKTLNQRINRLINIKNKQIGVIELSHDLDIDEVTEIFIRINASGVVLSNADFAMSKIAIYEKTEGDEYGMNLRKFIEYFCHLSVAPEYYKYIISNDKNFASKDYFRNISWLKNEFDDLYDPSYSDLIRVVSLDEFERGKISDLVALLSGRDFETRQNLDQIAEQSFQKLEHGIGNFTNENKFKHFIETLRSAGYIDKTMIPAKNAINYAYAVFLRLYTLGENHALINKYVRKLFVLSNLTARHSGSFETTFESDMKKIKSDGIAEFIGTLEEQELSDVFWDTVLVDELDKASFNNSFFYAFAAAQMKGNDMSFLTQHNTVKDLKTADIHHIFPKNFLLKKGKDRSEYNQIANFVFLRNDINVAISDQEPQTYFHDILSGENKPYHSDISGKKQLEENLIVNCIPHSVIDMTIDDYGDFLLERRKLMARKIKEYYHNL